MYDPFVGTGSLLVSAAKLTRCYVVGSDIDIRIVRVRAILAPLSCSRGPKRTPPTETHQHQPQLATTAQPADGRSMRDNFEQYGLGVPELLLLDTSRPAVRPGMALYDAIITDPPYGVRAGARKTGVPEDRMRPIPGKYHTPPPANT